MSQSIGTLEDVGKSFLVCDLCDFMVSKFDDLLLRDGHPCPHCIAKSIVADLNTPVTETPTNG